MAAERGTFAPEIRESWLDQQYVSCLPLGFDVSCRIVMYLMIASSCQNKVVHGAL